MTKAAAKKRKTEALQSATVRHQGKLRTEATGLSRSELLDKLTPVAGKLRGRAKAKAKVKAKAGAGEVTKAAVVKNKETLKASAKA